MTKLIRLLFSFFLLVLVGFTFIAIGTAQAAPTFQAAGTAVNATGAVTPTWPTHQIDDIALLIVESVGNQAVTLSTAAGFTAVTNSPQTTGTGTRISVFWARANSSSMASPTVADPGDHVYAQIITYRGVINTGNPWDVTSGGSKGTASTAVSVTGVTTTIADTLIVQIASRDLDSTAAAFSGQTNASLTGIAERVDAGTTSGNGGGFAVWDGVMATAGAVVNTTATVTNSVNAFLTIALKPGVFCSPPSNVPAGVTVTCVCDTFGRASLNPSTIYGGNWALSNSDGLGNPYINGTTGLLRLTENTASNAKAATVPSIFPAAGNYISVEFNHYAYNGTSPGADGIAITLSDYLVPAVPGGYGGSLGYAQRNDGTQPPGFAGGWVGIALDEYGNFQNPTEGRVLGPGAVVQSIGVRGPGSGANGYRYMGGTASSPGGLNIDNRASTTPAPGYMYQVVVDARNSSSGTINVSVNRDATTNNGTTYTSLFGPFNAYTEANFALSQGWITQIVPDYWKISFTGSTGGSNDIHEIGSLRVCAQSSFPATGGTASGFSAIDEAYPAAAGSTVPAYPNFSTGNIYMKLAGTPFQLWVAALTSSGISTAYSAVSNKFLQVKLVDNTDNACGTDVARTCNATCTNKAAVEAGTNATRIITMTNADPGAKLSGSFQLNSAWKRLIAIIKECTTVACTAFTATAPACSADAFSVRPPNITSVTSSDATNTGTTGTPIFKAGSATFSLTAATGVTGYTGMPKINNSTIQLIGGGAHLGTVAPAVFPAAATGTGSTTGTTFTYDEVGVFRLPGFTDDTTPRGVYDGVQTTTECTSLTSTQCDTTYRALTWTGIDGISTKGDCVLDSYSNTKVNGKYGCNFGNTANVTLGRFTPDHFSISSPSIINRIDMGGSTGCAPSSAFTYMGEPMKVNFTLNALNAAGTVTQNYVGSYAKLSTNTSAGWLAYGSSDSVGLWMNATNYTLNGSTCQVRFTNGTTTTFGFCTGAVPAAVSRAAGSRVTVVAGTPTTPNWNVSAPTAGTSLFSANVILERADTADGAYSTLNIGIAPQDTDGVKLSAFNLDTDNDTVNERTTLVTTDVRFGRMRISNNYGSELLNLLVDIQAQYWNGSAYTINGNDNCTPLTSSNFAMANWTGGAGGITAANMNIASNFSGAGTLASGVGQITLLKPNPASTVKGSVDLSTTGTISTYLPGTGRETFGVYKSGPVIYIRENY